MKTKLTKATASSEPRRILVPVDFSEFSLDALQHAQALAQRYNSQLVLLHVLEPIHADMIIDITQTQRAARAAAHERLTKLADATKKPGPAPVASFALVIQSRSSRQWPNA